eukprot:scaffold188_cov107-Isochrysis_galbana.AAC.14
MLMPFLVTLRSDRKGRTRSSSACDTTSPQGSSHRSLPSFEELPGRLTAAPVWVFFFQGFGLCSYACHHWSMGYRSWAWLSRSGGHGSCAAAGRAASANARRGFSLRLPSVRGCRGLRVARCARKKTQHGGSWRAVACGCRDLLAPLCMCMWTTPNSY